MQTGRDQQPLSYDVRLPDEAQADALRLLDAGRAIVNALLTALWQRLDEYMGERSGPAWKQVVTMTPSPDPHGDRQFRCEAQTAGRILGAQAEALPITVNYIRHHLTEYDEHLEEVAGQVGVREATATIRRRVYAEIAAHNPEYAEECQRQIRFRSGEAC